MKRVLVYVCLFAIAAIPTAAQPYSRRILAKSGDTIDGRILTNVGQPTLNGKAQVAFIAFSAGLAGVFTPDRLVAQTGDRIGRATLTGIAGPPALSDRGRILFNAATDRGTGIYSASDVIAETGDRIDGKVLTNVGPIQMAETGDLVFLSEFNGGRGIFHRSVLLAQTGAVVDGKSLTDVGYAPSINDLGQVAILGIYADGSGIFSRRSGFLVKTGDTIAGKTLTRVTFASLRNAGGLAFIGYFDGGSGIFTRLSLVAQNGTFAGKRVGGFGAVKLSDTGVVAFTSVPDYTSADCRLCNGVFTQNGVVAFTGDLIDGKLVSSIAHDIAINDAGEIVFAAAFTDGATGIVLAVPNAATRLVSVTHGSGLVNALSPAP